MVQPTDKDIEMKEEQGSALQRAQAIQARAAEVGFDWDHLRGVWEKVQEEIAELQEVLPSGDFQRRHDTLEPAQQAEIANELGDCLFALSNLARHLGIDAETAALGTLYKFQKRFAFVEAGLAKQGKSLHDAHLTEMDALWEQAKKEAL